jgi:hypothetical protein
MSNYVELLRRHLQAHKDASNGFHTADSTRKISDAIAGFTPLFNTLSSVIRQQRAGGHADFAIASRDALRLLDAQLNVLETAVRSAERPDRIKVQQIVVDRHVAKRKAEAQQAADAALVDKIKFLISQARDDAKEASKMHPDNGGRDGGELGPIDVNALKRSIEERKALKEDAVLAGQIALIGGQASQGVTPDNGGDLGPIDVNALKRSIAERAAPKEDRILAEQLAIIGGQASQGLFSQSRGGVGAQVPHAGGDELGPIDVDALKRSIAERAAPKEDRILAEQIAIIGGQASAT